MLRLDYIGGILLCFSFSVHAQIKFNPPKIKKPVDTSFQQQKQNVPSAVKDTPIVPIVSANTVAQLIPDSADSVVLPISDTIVIPLLDFNNQSIQDVLMLLSAPYGINIAVDPNLKARVTLRFSNIKLKDAIQFIIRESGYTFRIKNNIIQVYAPTLSPVPVVVYKTEQVFSVKDNRLTVDLKNAPLDSVIRWIAGRTGQNIIPEKGLKAEITAFFSDLGVEKGLKVLFETNGLELSEKDGLKYLIPAGGGFDGTSKEKPSRVKYFVSVKGDRISFNVNNAPIVEIIKEIARQMDLQVYLYSDIPGTVTAKVDSVAVDDAFESLLRNTSGTYWLSRRIYFFADRSTYEKKVIDIIPVNYLQADQIVSLLPGTVTSRATIKIVKEYNALLVEAQSSDVIDQAKEVVALLDKPIAQILIEAWVVEVKIDKLRQYGLELFAKSPGDASLSKKYYPSVQLEYGKKEVADFIQRSLGISANVAARIPENFAAQIQALESEGVSNLISRPQIATLNGNTATITFGTTLFYTLEKMEVVPGSNTNVVEKIQQREVIDVNMTLSVTPWVSSNNEVTMEISPTFDVPGASPDANTPPPISRRSLKSKVRVKSGEMIILGGLIGESQNVTSNKVPFLGSIPILKWIFSNKKIEKNKTQLMIYLIPHVYYGSERSIDPSTIDFKTFKEIGITKGKTDKP